MSFKTELDFKLWVLILLSYIFSLFLNTDISWIYARVMSMETEVTWREMDFS